MPNPRKSITLTPFKAVSQKDLEQEIDLTTINNKFTKTIQVVQSMVEWGRNSNHQEPEYYKAINDGANPDTGELLPKQNNETGRLLNYRYQEHLPEEMLVKSRVERLINHNHISDDKSMGKKWKAFDQEEFVSKGWSRTLKMTPPSPSPSINLGAVNNLYSTMVIENNIIKLSTVVYDIKAILYFKIPDYYVSQDYKKISMPIISLNKNGEIKYHFAMEFERQYPEITSKYVIGVDAGIKEPYVSSVIDTQTKRVVETIKPSQRVKSLARDIRITQEQISNLTSKMLKAHKKNDEYKYWICKLEIEQERRGLKRKRREFAILIGQEIANISVQYDNAVVAVEELGWVHNTMQNGRWNRGEQLKWLKHYCDLQGLLCYKVNANGTSQFCSSCGSKIVHKQDRLVYCKSCDVELDRDVNASINIAKRVVDSAIKSSLTRIETRKRKHRSKSLRKSVDRVPVRREVLKQPLRKKNRPTPKQVKKPRKKNVVLLSKVVNNEYYGSCDQGIVGEEAIWSSLDVKQPVVLSGFDQQSSRKQ